MGQRPERQRSDRRAARTIRRPRWARLAILVLATIGPAFVAGCGRAAVDGERATITMWFWGASPAYRQALQEALVIPFNSRQEKYRLVIEYRTTVDSDVRIAAIANRGPDIIYTSGPATVSPLGKAGKLEPSETYAKRYGWDDRLLAPVLDACRVFAKERAHGLGVADIPLSHF
jgi:raffinose/stachyose/melibiose transport system substrate-binding protein